MRLLSFLTEIERAIRMEANAGEGEIWNSARIVNFKTGLARLTLVSRDADSGMPEGTVLVQHFSLADGSFAMKASLAWQGSNATQSLAVYDTPLLNWKLEASRIGSAWLSGPPPQAAVTDAMATAVDHDHRVAVAG